MNGRRSIESGRITCLKIKNTCTGFVLQVQAFYLGCVRFVINLSGGRREELDSKSIIMTSCYGILLSIHIALQMHDDVCHVFFRYQMYVEKKKK